MEQRQASQHNAPKKEQAAKPGHQERDRKYEQDPPSHSTPFPPPYPHPSRGSAEPHVYPPSPYGARS